MAASEPTLNSDLVRRIHSGEPGVFQEIAQQYSGQLFRCAQSLCRNEQLAEDLTQETLLEGWRSIHRFDGRCQISTWLYGILRHRFLKAMRRQSMGESRVLALDAAFSIIPSNADPARETQQADDMALIRLAVAELPEEHRLVIELRFFAEATLDDIAVTLGIPLGTVKSRLHNGLQKLRQLNLAVNFLPARRESGVKSS